MSKRVTFHRGRLALVASRVYAQAKFRGNKLPVLAAILTMAEPTKTPKVMEAAWRGGSSA